MRILAVNAGAHMSGAESVLLDLLAHAGKEGWDRELLCPYGPLAEKGSALARHVEIPAMTPGSTRPGAAESRIGRIVRLATLPLRWLQSGARIRREARDADVVLVNSTMALPAIGVAFAERLYSGSTRRSRRRPRIVWLVHDTITHRKQQIAARLGGRALTLAIAVSSTTARSVESYVHDVVVRPNGVSIPPQPVTPPQNRTPVVGVLAVLTSWKGQHVAIDALAKAPGVTLEIAGSAFPGSEDYEQFLRTKVTELGLTDRVRFLGHVDKSSVFTRWDAMLSPSTSPEAGPLGVLEAMASGVPVIATNHGGSADYLRDGRGLLVAPGDSSALAHGIRHLTSDREKNENLRRVGREAAVNEHDLTSTIASMWQGISRD